MRRAFRRFTHWLYMALWFNARRRFARWLLRVGLLPSTAKADTDTMGEWKRLQAEKDDPRPGLVLPDPNAPHADLIRCVRLYAQNGAKALAQLLDAPMADSLAGAMNTIGLCHAVSDQDPEARGIIEAMGAAGSALSPERRWEMIQAIHAAYNAPWTVVDGEVYEYESERKRRVVQ